MDSKIELPTPISTDGPPVDVPLLRKAVEWAEAEAAKPETESEWFQSEYVLSAAEIGRSCGTVYCIAGHVVAAVHGAERARAWTPHLIDEGAASMIGLTGDESYSLFRSSNSIADVRTTAERIAARAGERL